MDLVCSARSGASNGGMFNKCVRDIFRNENVGAVMILWTQAIRFELYDSMRFNPSTIVPKMEEINSAVRSAAVKHNHVLKVSVDSYLNNIITLSNICKKMNIPLVMAQHSDFLSLYSHATIENDGIDEKTGFFINRIYDEIFMKKVVYMNSEGYDFDTSKFIGWPVLKALGGKSMKHIIHNIAGDEIFILPGIDRHPSKRGHELIAETYLQKYNDLYLQDKV